MLLNRLTRPYSVISRAVKRADLGGLHRQLLISPTSFTYINGESIQQLREPATEQESEWPTHCLSRSVSPHFFIHILLFLLSFCSLNFLVFSLSVYSCTDFSFFPIHFTTKSAEGKPILAAVFILISGASSFSFSFTLSLSICLLVIGRCPRSCFDFKKVLCCT